MSARTSHDTGAPTIEVRIDHDDQFLVRESVETEEDCSIASARVPGYGTE